MTINWYNFEVFFVDYLDGRLSSSLVAELLMFLDQNADLKEEVEGIQDAVLIGETITYPDKSNLKKKSFLKNGIDDEFDYLCIASVEGILTVNERDTLEKIIREDPNKKIHYLTFQKAIINPDATITFPSKSRLKRTSLILNHPSKRRQLISIAATAAFIVGVYTTVQLMVSEPVENYSKVSIAEPTISAVKTITDEVQNKVASTNKTIVRITPEQVILSENNKVIPLSPSARINIEEFIPNIIHRIEIKEISVQENHQPELLAQIVAKYNSTKPAPTDHLYTQQEFSKNGKRAREVGVFEIIQYGVQSFGKLIGNDINLDASKDNKRLASNQTLWHFLLL